MARDDQARGTVAIIGATSAIGRDIAAVLASRGTELILFARRKNEAQDIAADLRVRYRVRARARRLDVLDFDSDDLREDLADFDDLHGVISCVGYLGDNIAAITDKDEAERISDLNYTGPAKVLDISAASLAERRRGFVCALSSVAGDRPRRRVQAYGVAKSKLNAHMRELRARVRPMGVRVITVKLGPVDTRMPYGPHRQPFTVRPRDAATGVIRALAGDGVVYVPGKWRLIMAIVKAIPGFFYRRLDL